MSINAEIVFKKANKTYTEGVINNITVEFSPNQL